MPKRPNIVLITIDSLRADFVGYQNPREQNTPFLDSFAAKSFVFTNAISPANPTFFVFSSIMTGVLPFTYGKYLGIPNDPQIKTVSQVLKNNGYKTYAFLADSPALYPIFGYDRGFDHYDDGYNDTDKTYLSFLEFLWKLREKIPERILNILEIITTLAKVIFLKPQLPVSGKELNKKVKNYFKPKRREPFFLWLHYMDTHLPYYSGLYEYFFPNKNSIQRILGRLILFKELATSIRKMQIKNQKTNVIFQEAYRSCVKYTDRQLEEIINFLQTKYPNTIFIITSDHGEGFMEHGLFHHEAFSLYNELIHVPMIIHHPSLEPCQITKTVSLVSLAKTISEMAGIQEPQFQGDNILSIEPFSSVNNISRILYKCRSPHVHLGILDNSTEITGYTELWGFTTPSEKYIVEMGGHKEEYYNLLKDPQEKKNLIKKGSNHKRLMGKLKKFIVDY